MFSDYLSSLDSDEAQCLKKCVIDTVIELAPDAVEGLSYGLPAFKLNNKPLIGFSDNKHGLNVYPFDPRIVSVVIEEFPELDHSKGVVRFTVDSPIPKRAVELMAQLRIDFTSNK